MIVRPRPSAWELPFIWRLSILPRIAPQIMSVGLFATGVVFASHRWPGVLHNFSVAPFTLLGIALSIFLGFRNNACYERWWEARRQLGAMIGEMRSFSRWTLSLPCASGNRERRVRLVCRAIGYQYALMAHLRGDSMPTEVERYTPDLASLANARNLPNALLRAMAQESAAMLSDGEFGEVAFARFDERLANFAAMQVACGRILGTPLPFTYTLLLHRTAYAFCFMLPFGLAGNFGWVTPVFCALVAYAFFGLDALGDELQEPFGRGMNALPLYAMARTVEISLLEAAGSELIPRPLGPTGNILR
ncbi:MAG: bestrophin family protein [Janthinobacterium lividum]